MVECEVDIFCEGKFVMILGGGILEVCKFAKLADAGIDGAIEIVDSFACNRDVTINGEKLIEFINKEYPDSIEKARQIIRDEKIYKIVCYDMS